MINIKTEKEIKSMAEGGKILSDVLWEVLGNAKPGVSEIELDELAEELIIKRGGEPGFKKVPGYNNTICVSANDIVVHGIPTAYKLKEGDVLGIDCGVFYKGFHTDMSETIRIQNSPARKASQSDAGGELRIKNDDIDKFLEIGKKALNEGIKIAKVGNRIGNISKTIQDIVEKQNGYSVVRSLVGHGVGKELHEEPEVPGFLAVPIEKTPKLREGMTIAIEVIYNMGRSEVVMDLDNWTIRSKDKSISGVFERTVAVSLGEPLILT